MHKKRVFSGVQPTGNLHLGNYLGAMKNFVDLQNKFECVYCIVDLHAITNRQNPNELKSNILETIASFIASGLNPEKNIIFNQASVAAHSELAWIFNCVARIGWMNRMTQFKEKAGANKENASVGLLVYPNLMAADILLYKATHVPVGEDQKQHLELTRDIAKKFNNDFKCGDYFPIVEPLIPKEISRVMSLRDGKKKMSKSEDSDQSRINLKDNKDLIDRKIKKAKTDTAPIPSGEGAVRCMKMSLKTRRNEIDYINTHGTSTPVGDITELNAIKETFQNKIPKISSTKSLTGHPLGAASVHEAIYSLIMMENNFIAASANIKDMDDGAKSFPIVTKVEKNVSLNAVMSNSFGFGGTNSTLVFEKLN